MSDPTSAVRSMLGRSSRAEHLFKQQWSFPIFMFLTFGIFIACIILAVVWGISTLVGLVFIGYAGMILVLRRGNYIDHTVIIFAAIGIFFLILSYLGITFGVIDFSQYEITRAIHFLFN